MRHDPTFEERARAVALAEIRRLQRAGGPTPLDRLRADLILNMIETRPPGDRYFDGDRWGQAIAVCAFAPGGVSVFGHTYQVRRAGQ